jgi:hypothetical protein
MFTGALAVNYPYDGSFDVNPKYSATDDDDVFCEDGKHVRDQSS